MKEIISIYKTNKITIENYIHSIVKSMPSDYLASIKTILDKYHFIQLMYETDLEYRPIPRRKYHKALRRRMTWGRS